MGFLPKDYVGVHTRVEKFHADHKTNMGINTEFKLDGKIAIFKATVITSKGTFTGSSFGELGKEKAFEKLETVAVGRALAFAGYEVKEGIASNEEMQEFEKKQKEVTKTATKGSIVDGKCSKCGKAPIKSKAGNDYCACWY